MHQSAKNLSIWVIECAGGYIEFLQNFVGLKLLKKKHKSVFRVHVFGEWV